MTRSTSISQPWALSAKSPSRSNFKHAVYGLRYYYRLLGQNKRAITLPSLKIRHYGIYSSRALALKEKRNPKMIVKTKAIETTQERLMRLTGFDVYLCPFCKQGIMHRIEDMPRVRSPTIMYSQAVAGKQ